MKTIITTKEEGYVPHNLHSAKTACKVTVLNIPYQLIESSKKTWMDRDQQERDNARRIVAKELKMYPKNIGFTSNPTPNYSSGPDSIVGVKVLTVSKAGFTPAEYGKKLPYHTRDGVLAKNKATGKVEYYQAAGNMSAMMSGNDYASKGDMITQRWDETAYKVRVTV